MPVILVRHGESQYNAARFPAHYTGNRDPLIIDPLLTETGRIQATRLREKLVGHSCIVSSPLTRALHTARLSLCNDNEPLPSQIEFIASPLCAEPMYHSCNIGSTRSVLQTKFVGVDFSQLTEEVWWYCGEYSKSTQDWTSIFRQEPFIEPKNLVLERVSAFAAYLIGLLNTHESITVFSHQDFLHSLSGYWLANCECLEIDLARLQYVADYRQES